MGVTLQWLGTGTQFAGGPDGGPSMVVDGDGKVAISPMTTFLTGLCACTASDIVEIAVKMRVRMAALHVRAEDERRAEPPRRYTRLRLIYTLNGVDTGDHDKIRRAVALSHEKYCSALNSLRQDIEVATDIIFEPA
jgi:putative redox protein